LTQWQDTWQDSPFLGKEKPWKSLNFQGISLAADEGFEVPDVLFFRVIACLLS